MSSKFHGGSSRAVSSRRSLLAMGATGLLAGGVAVAVTDATTTTAADAATTTGTPDWIDVTTIPNTPADPTGAIDSASAFTAAIAALPSGGGVVYVPAGTYKIASTVKCTTVPVYFVGDGAWATTISFTGTGDCFYIYDPSTYGSRMKFGGGFVGITIDGTQRGGQRDRPTSGRPAAVRGRPDRAENFQSSTAGDNRVGVHFDNNYYWTEQLYGRIYAQNCSSHVVFDWTSGTSTTSSGSFERCDLDIYVNQQQGGDGVVFQNGAFVTNGSLKLRGNFGYHATQTATAALKLTGSGSANGYPSSSGIVDSMLDIGVECASKTGDYTPHTIIFGASGNQISGCYGALNFGAAGNTFTASNNKKNVVEFVGKSSGDSTLPGQTSWVTYTGTALPTGITGNVSVRFLPTGNEVMVSWGLAIASGTKMTSGATIVTAATQYSPGGNKLIPANLTGSGVTGNAYAPAEISPGGGFKYLGPTYTSTGGSSWWFGQGVYTLSVG